MPTVPRISRRVSERPIGPNQRSAAETPESLGAGLARAQGQAAEAAEGVFANVAHITGAEAVKLATEERQRADELAVLEADNTLAGWENRTMTEMQDVRGQQARGLPEKVMGDFNKLAGELDAKLNPQQRARFAAIKARRGENLDLNVQRHTFEQLRNEEANQYTVGIDHDITSAIANAADTDRVAQDLASAIGRVKERGTKLGSSKDVIDSQVEAVISKVHAGVIGRLLDNDETGKARAYYQQTETFIDGKVRGTIEKNLRAGDVKSEGRAKALEILAAGGTLKEQTAKADKIEDVDVADEVKRRLNAQAAVNEKDERDRDEDAAKLAYSIIDKTGKVDDVPITMWSGFSGGTRASLRAYANAKARGIDVETNWDLYYDLIDTAGTDPDGFATTNLREFQGHLSDGEFKEILGLQLSIRNRDSKAADAMLDGYRTSTQVIADSLALYGIDASDKKSAAAVSQLRRMVDRRVRTLQASTGKKATPDDVEAIADDILSQKHTVPGSWWSIWPGGESFTDVVKPLISVTPGDIPKKEREMIEKALRGRGMPASDQSVLDMYLEALSRTKKRNAGGS